MSVAGKRGLLKTLAALTLTAAATATATLTTWPTDGLEHVIGNYGMTEYDDTRPGWIHHPEIDVPGTPDTTTVQAVRDGLIWYVHPLRPDSDSLIIGFEVQYAADTLTYSYHHVRPLDPSHPGYIDMKNAYPGSVHTYIPVTEGQLLGYVRAVHDSINPCAYPHVAFAVSKRLVHLYSLWCYTRNPLIEYGSIDPSASDGDDLPDIHQIFARKVPELGDPNELFDPEDPIYATVDIISEMTDDQGDIIWPGTQHYPGSDFDFFSGIISVPLKAGYWIDGPTADVLDPGPNGPFLYLMDFSTWQGSGDTLQAIYDIWLSVDADPDPIHISPRCYNFELTHTDRDSTKHWFTNHLAGGGDADTAYQNSDAEFPDGTYRVHVIAKDLQGEREDSLDVQVDNFPPYVHELKVFEVHPGPDTSTVYHAEWDIDADTLMVLVDSSTTIDTLKCQIRFSETMNTDPDSILVTFGQPPDYLLETYCEFSTQRWDSVKFKNDCWTGVMWLLPQVGNVRNHLAGRHTISILAVDEGGHRLDTNPATPAYRETTGDFLQYEDDDDSNSQSGGHSRRHKFTLTPWIDILVMGDLSGSVYNYWANAAINVPHHMFDYMIDMHNSLGYKGIYRGGLYRYWASPGSQGTVVELIRDLNPDLAYVQEGLVTLYGMGPANWCSNQQAPMWEAVPYLMSSESQPRILLYMTDGQINSGEYIESQIATWQLAANDSAYGTDTIIYLVTPEERRNVPDGLLSAISNSGGWAWSVPRDSLYDDPSVSERLYEQITHTVVRYQIMEDTPGPRSSHDFYVDPMMSAILVLGSWTDWGMQLAHTEPYCWTGRGCRSCGDDSLTEKQILSEREHPLPGDVEKERKLRSESKVGSHKREQSPSPRGDRATFQLYDASSAEITPTGTLGTNVYWSLGVDASDVGQWQLVVTGSSPYHARVASKSVVRLDMAGRRAMAAGATSVVKVEVVGTTLTSPDWALVGLDGAVYDDAIELYDDGAHDDDNAGDNIWATAYVFPDSGIFRVLARWSHEGNEYERSTASAIKVYRAPSFVYVEPDGVGDETGSNFTIRWTGESELSATLSLFYDDDNMGADGDTIATGLPVISGEDSLRWNVWGVEQGDYYLYAEIEEDAGVNPAQVVYSDHQVTVTTGAQENFPVSTGGRVRASPVAVDLEDNGSELELVIASEDSCLYIYDYQANLLPGFPLRLAEKLSSTPAVGNIDTLTTSLELVVGARDDSGTLYCVDHNAGSVSGWPVSLGSPIWSAPTLADLDTPPNGDLEVIVACGSQVHVRRSDGTVFPGWPQTIGCSSVLFTSPCVANYDPSDDELEIAVCGGTDTLYVFDATGSLEWKERVVGSFVWSPLSSGDLDFDGSPEILVQTWDASQSRLYAFKGDGTAPAGWETPIQVGLQARSGAALGDLDGDGRLEVLVGDGNIGKVYGYASDGTALPGPWGSGIQIATRTYSPLCIVDLDGNGSCEAIVLGINNDKMNVVDQNGMVLESWSRALDGDSYGAPAIADIDLDGDTEILIGTDAGTVFCFDFGGTYSPLRMEYPKFQADLGNTGNYTEEIPPQPPVVETIEVVNGDELQLTWNTVSTDSLSRQELVTTYRVYRGSTAWFETGSLVGVVSMPETTYTDTTTGVVGDAGVNYAYEVTALDQHGNESEVSSRVGEHDFSSGGRAQTDRKESVER